MVELFNEQSLIPISDDEDTKKGRFGWFELGPGTHRYLPYLFRGTDEVVSVRMVEKFLVPWYGLQTKTGASVTTFNTTEAESKLLNHINKKHTDYLYGKEKFSIIDQLVTRRDVENLQQSLDFCHRKVINNQATRQTTKFEMSGSKKLRLVDVAFFSAEHPKHTVKSFINGQGRWTTPSNYKMDTLEAEFSLAQPSTITGIDVGNFWSSSIQVLVGRSEWPQSTRKVLLQEFCFMNRLDCVQGDNKEKMAFLRGSQLSQELTGQEWDRVKVICRQPFKYNHDVFGLSMFVLHGSIKEIEKNEVTMTPSLSPGMAAFNKKVNEMSRESKKTISNMSRSAQLLAQAKQVNQGSGSGRSVTPTSSTTQSASTNQPTIISRSVNSQSDKINLSGKMDFRSEAIQFLRDCQFDKLSFAQVELITFRRVKELWIEKHKPALSKENKDTLKSLSSQYLTKLITKGGQKRNRDTEDGEVDAKRRKVSDQILKMRNTVDLEEDTSNSSSRNKVATMDTLEKEEENSKTLSRNDKEKNNIKSYFNSQTKSRVISSPKHELRTPKSNSDLTKVLERMVTSPKHGIRTPKSNSSLLKRGAVATSTPNGHQDAIFDLDFSPELKKSLNPPRSNKEPDKDSMKTPFVYNRSRLKDFPDEQLIEAGVLVQTYKYKKDKELPLKGSSTLYTSKGCPVTFYKVGPEIHLLYRDKFHLPEIQTEHLERVFKSFSKEQTMDRNYPSGFRSLLNQGERKENTSPRIRKDKIPTDKSPEKSKVFSVDEKKGQCPICSLDIHMDKLESHAATCEIFLSDDEIEEKKKVSCPICSTEVDREMLEQHAVNCAASRFGV